MKILIVDDEVSIAEVFKQALQQGGYEVILAANGQEGKAKAISEKPDLVLLDQILPDMTGNQVLQYLKEEEITKNIPVAILSNFNQEKLVDEAVKFGSAEYILKYQISPQDLVEKIKTLLATKNGTGWQDTHDEGL